MGTLHMRQVGVVFGQADHQPQALPKVVAGLFQGAEHHCTCAAGMATYADSFAVGAFDARAAITVRTP